MKPHTALKKARKLRKRFVRLNPESPRQVRRLHQDVERRHKVLTDAIQALETRKDEVTSRLDRYQEKERALVEREQETAERLEAAPEQEAEARFQLARQLRSVQLDLTMLGRERTDLHLTLASLRSWLLSLDEAAGITRLLEESLKRNVDRLALAEVVRGKATTPEAQTKCGAAEEDLGLRAVAYDLHGAYNEARVLKRHLLASPAADDIKLLVGNVQRIGQMLHQISRTLGLTSPLPDLGYPEMWFGTPDGADKELNQGEKDYSALAGRLKTELYGCSVYEDGKRK